MTEMQPPHVSADHPNGVCDNCGADAPKWRGSSDGWLCDDCAAETLDQ